MNYSFYAFIISAFVVSAPIAEAHVVAVCSNAAFNSSEGAGAYCPSVCETYSIVNGDPENYYTWYKGQYSCTPQSDWPPNCICQCSCED